MPQVGSFEIIEHTADVGIRARGATLEEVFEQTTLGLIDILGVWRPGEGHEIEISLEGRDHGGLLVDWLNEVLYVQESRDAVFTAVAVAEVSDDRVRGVVGVADRREPVEGTAVKAATFHRLEVRPDDDDWVATVYVDV